MDLLIWAQCHVAIPVPFVPFPRSLSAKLNNGRSVTGLTLRVSN